MIGPTLYIKISNHVSIQNIVSGCFVLMMCCGLIVFNFGCLSPWLFALAVAASTVTVITMRVPRANLMLEQQQRDTGTAAIRGCLSLTLVPAEYENS
jgi:DHA1 family bicyclomycin/chloramphenicol resistance-like MFS transporter